MLSKRDKVMAEIWSSWANQDAAGQRRAPNNQIAASSAVNKKESKMCYAKLIDGKEYLVITPGYLSIDASVSAEFKEKLCNIIKEENYYLLLDLINVKYIDSIGLASLISTLKTLKNKGDIALVNLTDTVNSYFKLTRMDRVFSIYDIEL